MKNSCSEKAHTLIRLLIPYLLPLSFIFAALLNISFFYLGLAYVDNPIRKYGYILGCVLFALVCGICFLDTLKHTRTEKRVWFCGLFVAAFFGICYLLMFFQFGFEPKLIQYAKEFVVLSAPAFLAGACTALNKAEKSFLPLVERFSFLMLPAAVIYMNGALFNCSGFTEGYDLGLGTLNYMNVAYTFLPYLLAHLLQFSKKAPFYIPFLKKNCSHPQWMRGVFSVIYWIAILASGTRGTYVCTVGVCILLFASNVIRKKNPRPGALLSAILIGSMLFSMFVYAPPGMHRVSRMTTFVVNAAQGDVSTSNMESEELSDSLDELVSVEEHIQVTNRPEQTPSEQAPAEQTPSEQAPAEQSSDVEAVSKNYHLSNRKTQYILAWKEFQKAPLFGLGPGGYTAKYGIYPHNALLEVLCETGIIGTVAFLALLFAALFKMFRLSSKNDDIRLLFLFILAYAIAANISGSVWSCTALMCAFGFSLSYSSKQEPT